MLRDCLLHTLHRARSWLLWDSFYLLVYWPEVRVVYTFRCPKCPNFQTPAKPASDWLEKNLRAVSYGRIHVTNIKILWILKYAFLFVYTSIDTTIYIIEMADPTVIKYSKCHIHKPCFNFVKDGPLKKILKLCQLCWLKVHLLYILFLLLFTFLGLQIWFK